ncbi:MAG: transglutaminase-like domain-containing protein [Prolixibacteraceae bacterium]
MNKRFLFLGIICLLIISGCTPFYQLINASPSSRLKNITFSNSESNPVYEFYYSDTLKNEYLRDLRQEYQLDVLTEELDTEFEKIKAIVAWTNQQWEHNGSNNPSKPDALTILKEADTGKKFRCVEYGIVASSALNSIGIPARVLGLKTRDVEKVRHGAGHVVAEAYSTNLKKWIFVDPQFNVIPMLNGTPLNAIEFQNAIMNNRLKLKLTNSQGDVSVEITSDYINWVAKYLFYFDTLFDQGIGNEPNYKAINGMTKITLVPVGEKEPKVFQRYSKINYSYYTNSLNDFYKNPK